MIASMKMNSVTSNRSRMSFEDFNEYNDNLIVNKKNKPNRKQGRNNKRNWE